MQPLLQRQWPDSSYNLLDAAFLRAAFESAEYYQTHMRTAAAFATDLDLLTGDSLLRRLSGPVAASREGQCTLRSSRGSPRASNGSRYSLNRIINFNVVQMCFWTRWLFLSKKATLPLGVRRAGVPDGPQTWHMRDPRVRA
jgi:hypothetical protein